MKKIFLLAFVTILSVVTLHAQRNDMLMATLQHNDRTSIFYGINALVDAYNAAADSGDVITLSSGSFNPAAIHKSVSIYGAGMEKDTLNNIEPTIIDKFEIDPVDLEYIDEDGNTKLIKGGKHVNNITIEGIFCYGIDLYNNSSVPIENLTIKKCKLEYIYFQDNLIANNITIMQSAIQRMTTSGNGNCCHVNNFLLTNSWVSYCDGFERTSTGKVDHCIIIGSSSAFNYTNNIIASTLNRGATAYNNIFVDQTSTGLSVTQEENNYLNMKPAGVYVNEGDGSTTYSATASYALKYPNKYVGNDGTQIGVYGGVYGWNKTTEIPRVTSSAIDVKTTNEGKLKVTIAAEAQTKY